MSVLKHILSIILFAAFANVWIPHEVFLELHQHEHTSHDSNAPGVYFDNPHHHCLNVQICPLKENIYAFISGRLFFKNERIQRQFIYPDIFIRSFENEVVRGPPTGDLI